MRKLASVAATLLLAASMGSGVAPAQTADDAFGVWLNPENQSNVEFYRCGEGLCAKITKVSDAQKTDDKNPDPAKRSRPIVGLVIMEGAKRSGANTWSGTSTTGPTARAIRAPSPSRPRTPSICRGAWRSSSAAPPPGPA